MFATALETTQSYLSLWSLFRAKSSARECTAVISSSPNLDITSFKKIILLFKESSRVIFLLLSAIFIGMPGKPAPVPISIMVLKL